MRFYGAKVPKRLLCVKGLGKSPGDSSDDGFLALEGMHAAGQS